MRASIFAFSARENKGDLSPSERGALATEVRSLFYSGQLPKASADAVRAQVAAILPGIAKLKIRSSANAEDIPGFDGAGLHDSFGAEPASTNNADGSCKIIDDGSVATKLKVEPKTIECAVKAVYASLWNQRAIEERSFAHLDHATSGMGLSVVPAHDTDGEIVGNAVVITRAVNTEDVIGYSLSVQEDDNLVTNPDPGTVAELTYAVFSDETQPPHFTTAHFATPKADVPPRKSTVLTPAQMNQIVDMSKQVERQYCKSKPGYFDGDCDFVHLDPEKPNSLDMELKILDSGHIVLKQVREFSGR
jgi:phosphoenolpyruvate synthase/pyruvate phosphate dikinase